jgi:hypothetical protein
MIDCLITSVTRIKLLRKFFLNSGTRAHLRGLGTEFGESTNSIRLELNRLEAAGLLNSDISGNKKFYQANVKHPLFKDIHNIILKESGIDQVIEKVINKLGNLLRVYLTGDFAGGKDSSIIDLILVGNGIDREYLVRKVVQAEDLVSRKIRYIILDTEEANDHLAKYKPAEILLLWDCEKKG